MLRGYNVKDKFGCNAVFDAQCASASRMAAATVLNTRSRLLGMAGEAKDAVSAYTAKSKGRLQIVEASGNGMPQYRYVFFVVVIQPTGTTSTI